MDRSGEFIGASEAARRLGVSPKALRLYERQGLLVPVRTAAGWRTYGPTEMARAGEIAALRALGLSLAQVARALGGEAACLEPALAAHQAALEVQAHRLAETIERVRGLRAGLADGRAPLAGELARLVRRPTACAVAFDLPWPWGGERFELRDIRSLTFIVGPLGSGKTRLLRKIAEALPGAGFLGLDRSAGDGAGSRTQLDADPALKARVDRALAWLADEGAASSASLVALLVALESDDSAPLVIDMVEQGLDQASQQALIAYLRRRAPGARPLFMTTRSCAILDLAAVGADETIILCPANHRPPTQVFPYPGAAGYEAVATCLASPAVRARTEGTIAWRPQVA
ncbi:MAG: MerR family transcriptional regulator [Alphaproteobacteria bacterium]|nr:MerR family transcriptional regulator [Alphaproteobacteria bacterium]